MTITIEVNKDNAIATTVSEPVTVDAFLNATSTAQLGAMQTYVASIPEDQREKVIKDLYDSYNIIASTVLSAFAPDLELRPDLTEEAIMEAEKMIMKRYNKKKHKHERF